MKKILIVLILISILIFSTLFYLVSLKGKKPIKKETVEEVSQKEIEIYSLTGIVSKVDIENNFLMVMPSEGGDEVKVIVSKETKIFKTIYPSKKGNPVFMTEKIEIKIKEIKEGDLVFIKSKTNIYGKKVIENVEYIEVL